jgi:outer membrane protein assembly factor BamB
MVAVKGTLTCLEAKTGKVVWEERLSGNYGASLLHANGRIYVSSKKGKTIVVEPGRTFKKLAENDLEGGFWASPAVEGNSLLLRTETHLYRIQDNQ